MLARKHGVAPENVTTGCGSDDVIDSALRAFCDPGDAVAYADPTFGMISLFARMNAARPVAVPLAPDFSLDADALIAARARVTYICRPNNPTGTVLDAAAVLRIAEAGHGIVLLDKAYVDFMDEPAQDWLAASDRIVVLRTLSKAYGLAGLRVGYAIGPAPLIREIGSRAGRTRSPRRRTPPRWRRSRKTSPGCAMRATGPREPRTARRRAARARPACVAVADQLPAGAGAGRRRASGEPNAARRLGAALRGRGVAVRVFPALPHAGDCIPREYRPWPLDAAVPGCATGGARMTEVGR